MRTRRISTASGTDFLMTLRLPARDSKSSRKIRWIEINLSFRELFTRLLLATMMPCAGISLASYRIPAASFPIPLMRSISNLG
jgi:hypothetical protein